MWRIFADSPTGDRSFGFADAWQKRFSLAARIKRIPRIDANSSVSRERFERPNLPWIFR